MMPRKKLHKATLKGTIALYKKRKLPHPVSSAKGYMCGYTVPYHNEHPAYFFLRNCEGEVNENDKIQVDFVEGWNKKLS